MPCGCAQLRQTAEFMSAHGGRVCWDEATLSFAMAVDEQLDRVKDEVRPGGIRARFQDRIGLGSKGARCDAGSTRPPS